MVRCGCGKVWVLASNLGVRMASISAAIERAMAYLDTGELPWDMDLFDKSNNIVGGALCVGVVIMEHSTHI